MLSYLFDNYVCIWIYIGSDNPDTASCKYCIKRLRADSYVPVLLVKVHRQVRAMVFPLICLDQILCTPVDIHTSSINSTASYIEFYFNPVWIAPLQDSVRYHISSGYRLWHASYQTVGIYKSPWAATTRQHHTMCIPNTLQKTGTEGHQMQWSLTRTTGSLWSHLTTGHVLHTTATSKDARYLTIHPPHRTTSTRSWRRQPGHTASPTPQTVHLKRPQSW